MKSKEKNLYIIDDILLFNHGLSDKETIKFNFSMDKKSNFFKYTKVIFYTYNIKTIHRTVSKMLYLYTHFFGKKVYINDCFGSEIKVNFMYILKLIFKYSYDYFDIENVIKTIENDVLKLSKENIEKKFNYEDNPIYIKTTGAFGIQSGGAVTHSSGVIKSLKEVYKSPMVFTTDCLSNEIKQVYISNIVMERYSDFSELDLMYMNISAYKLIDKMIQNVNKSFVYQRASLYNYIGAKLANKYKLPFVLEFNNFEVWLSRNWGSGLKYIKLASKVEQLNLKKADLIVCISEELKIQLIDRGISEDKILVNYNGVDTNIFDDNISKKRIVDKYSLYDKTVIGFVGSFDVFHGVENLAKAYGELIKNYPQYRQNIRLMLIGEGKSKIKAEKILRKYKVDDISILTGSVKYEEVPQYLAACDILVAPHVPNKDNSPFFGSPTKLFEYMAMGKGIVASNLNQIGEILKDNETALLVEPNNIDELMLKMKALIDNENLRIELGRNARKVVEQYYTWDTHVKNIINKLKNMYQL